MSEGLAATLFPPLDLVLQLHMQPTGKPEPIQPTVAFYFTAVAPTNTPFKIGLSSYAIDIPAGSTTFSIQDSYTLPIDMELLGLLPHAHYLAKRMEAFATLPGGAARCLLLIKDWDFNWQSDFRCAVPVLLPRGTRLSMRYTYDNSAENVRNPNQPPVRVAYGLQSRDEMGELWLQLLPLHRTDLDLLQADYQNHLARDAIEFSTLQLQHDPNNAHAHAQLGKALLFQSRIPEALAHLQKAVSLQPANDEAHYNLGLIASQAGDARLAMAEFLDAIRSNPGNFRAHNNAGLIYLDQNLLDEAEFHFKEGTADFADVTDVDEASFTSSKWSGRPNQCLQRPWRECLDFIASVIGAESVSLAVRQSMIVFDVDGTLVGGEATDWASFGAAFEEAAGFVLDDRFFARIEEVTAQAIVHQALEGVPIEKKKRMECAVRQGYLRRLQSAHENDPCSFPALDGALALLAELKERGVPVAIATGDWFESITFKLQAAGIPFYALPMVTSSDFYSRADIIAGAIAKAGRPMQEAVYIGDGLWDLRASRKLGIPFIGVGHRKEKLETAGARYTLPDLSPFNFWRVMGIIRSHRMQRAPR